MLPCDLPPDVLASLWAHVPAEQRASIRAAARKGLEALKTPEPISLPDWANKHFYLSAESSQAQKRWESYPYQVGMLHAMGDDHIEEVTIKKSARVGYTKMILAAMAYFAQHKRRNQCIWQPTDADSDEFCKAEVEPMLRDVRVMQTVLPSFMRKSKANTLNMKKFLGSILFMKGGTSSGNYRRMTLQVAIGDEFSAFDQKIEKSSDPWTLMHKRLEGATYPKLILGSTPRLKGLDHIERREQAATARMRYHLACPHCGEDHPLLPGRLDVSLINQGKPVRTGFQWDAEDPEGSVRHVCPHCLQSIDQATYLELWHHGHWASDCGNYHLYADGTWTDGTGCKLTHPPRHVAFHVWTAYSPQTTWAVIVREMLDALRAKQAGDAAALEGFTNETLGETWQEEVEANDSHELQKRAEAYPLRRVPPGGLELVAGVDVQDKWWAVTVYAIGRGEESWVIDWQVIEGNLSKQTEWEERLYPYLCTTFWHWHGAPMRIRAVGIDTGGNHTHDVYTFARNHAHEKFFALKGDSQPHKPIKGRSSSQDVNYRGRILKNGVKLHMVGTDTAKDLIFGRLKIEQPGPGYMHFSEFLPLEFYTGLTSEVRRTVRTARGDVKHWVKTVARNEPLDTTVYAIFASHALGHHTYTQHMWDRLEQSLLPDLFSPAPPMPEQPAAQPVVNQQMTTQQAAVAAAVTATPTQGPAHEQAIQQPENASKKEAENTIPASADAQKHDENEHENAHAQQRPPLTQHAASAGEQAQPKPTPPATQPVRIATKPVARRRTPAPARPFAPSGWLERGFT
jgi:phage terminase large subunit GpA-like protein